MTEETFEGTNGARLFARSWRPEGSARGVAILQHGLKAHSGLYQWPAEQLRNQGIAVYAMDLRGHGKSTGERYYVDKFEEFVADLHRFVQRVKAAEPDLPVFLLGHSAGGVVACAYALEHPGELAGLLCESFAYEIPAPNFALALLKGLSHIAPHAHVLELKSPDFSRDPNFVAAMDHDPLIPKIKYPTQTVAELARADERIGKGSSSITLPVFILHGTADHVTNPSGSQRFHREVSSPDKTLKLYQDHYHDLLNDKDKEVVMADVSDWITRHLAH
jgi:alpha-beta hydrolase superfamily lysophospholipase